MLYSNFVWKDSKVPVQAKEVQVQAKEVPVQASK
jgi:hypothetical protein